MTFGIRFLIQLCCVVMVTGMMMGCAPVVRERTLPVSVRAVYVPMVENRTQEPGLEERLTVAFQEELLADGRIDLVREKEADAIIKVTIRQFSDEAISFDDDTFGVSRILRLNADMEVLENIPGRPAIGETRKLKVVAVRNADTRETTFEPEVDGVTKLARNFGRTATLELITGEYGEASGDISWATELMEESD